MGISSGTSTRWHSSSTVSRSNWNLEIMLVFEERENQSTRRKISWSKDDNRQQTRPTSDVESATRAWVTLWWEASALTTAPFLLPT